MQPKLETFAEYMKYLQKSVELLCKNYGRIGGFWFDGMWSSAADDWEEDTLYGIIRKHQPECMIINNTGLDARGVPGHIEIDSVTFERGMPQAINLAGSPKYIASEMCETLNQHWGYTSRDLHYKSLAALIECLAECRKFGCNLLLNVGPKGDGTLRLMDRAIFEGIGDWINIYGEAVYDVSPMSGIIPEKSEGAERDFLLKGKNCYYLFAFGVHMSADPNVQRGGRSERRIAFQIPEKISSVKWLDGASAECKEEEGCQILHVEPFAYGTDLVVRAAKIEIES